MSHIYSLSSWEILLCHDIFMLIPVTTSCDTNKCHLHNNNILAMLPMPVFSSKHTVSKTNREGTFFPSVWSKCLVSIEVQVYFNILWNLLHYKFLCTTEIIKGKHIIQYQNVKICLNFISAVLNIFSLSERESSYHFANQK